MTALVFNQIETSLKLTTAFRKAREALPAPNEELDKVQKVWVESLESGMYRLKEFGGKTVLVGRISQEKLDWLQEMQTELKEPMEELWQEIAVSLIADQLEPQTQVAIRMERCVAESILNNYDRRRPSPKTRELAEQHGLRDMLPGTGSAQKLALWVLFDGEGREEELRPTVEAFKSAYFYPKWRDTLRWLRALRGRIGDGLGDWEQATVQSVMDSISDSDRHALCQRLLSDGGLARYALERLEQTDPKFSWQVLNQACRRICPEAWQR